MSASAIAGERTLVACWRLRFAIANFSLLPLFIQHSRRMEDRFGGTPKPARQRRALPGMFAPMRGLWRRCGRRSMRAKIKLHRRRFFRARLRSEEWFRRKTEHARDQICRKAAHRHVVVLHRLVEVPALDGNSVLGSFQLRLQTEKVLVGF